jgi:RnfABCDGE-type electron transport complex B subunit
MGSLIIISILAMVGLAVLFAFVLSLADRRLRVEEDPTIKALLEVLPGSNCAACGFASCRAMAESMAEKGSAADACPAGGEEVASQVGEVLGVEIEGAPSQYPRVRCGARASERKREANYQGIQTCQAAHLLGGGLACSYGCLGFGDCKNACPFDAIYMEEGLPHIDVEKCTGCGLCVKACVRDLITMGPIDDDLEYFVACANLDRGKEARKVCKKACIGCGLCVKVCPYDAVEMENNLAKIDQRNCQECGLCAEKCPTAAIIDLGTYQSWKKIRKPKEPVSNLAMP